MLPTSAPAIAQEAAGASKTFAARLVEAARARVGQTVLYDASYVSLKYPGGDVPNDRGVCTDVIVRSYRALGVDLQMLIHEDMRRAFSKYPRRWGLKRTDRNIDHRRVPNMRVYFNRNGTAMSVSADANAYKPGDLVTWDLRAPYSAAEAGARPSKRTSFARTPHIGIVSDRRSADGKRPLIIHNIGFGTLEGDMLFSYRITGHYRFRLE